MESIQTKMLQATQPANESPPQMFKTEELAPSGIDDYSAITKKVAEEICDALSPRGDSSPHFGPSLKMESQ